MQAGQLVYDNEIVGKHDLYSCCKSTLNDVSQKDYPNKNYFDSRIECLDMDYYEKYLLNATKEERDCYIKEHPDFMNEYPVSYEHRELLQDKIYRGLMRKIRDYEKSREQ